MAPVTKKGIKRDAKPVKEPVSKKPKHDPQFQAVVDGLTATTQEELPETCREMLLAMMPGSLSVAGDERSPQHARVNAMLGEALMKVQDRYRRAVETKVATIEDLDRSHRELEAALQQTESAAASVAEEVSAKKTEVSDAQGVVATARSTLGDALKTQREEDAVVNAAEAERQELHAALDQHLTALCGEPVEGSDNTKQVDELMQAVKKTKAEESLQVSLNASLTKPRTERGEFDDVVIAQAQTLLKEKLAELTATVEAGSEAKSKRAEAVEQAQQSLEEVEKALRSKKDQLLDAEVASQNAECNVSEAKAKCSEMTKQVGKAKAEKDAEQAVLDFFEAHNIGAFRGLEKKTSPASQAGA